MRHVVPKTQMSRQKYARFVTLQTCATYLITLFKYFQVEYVVNIFQDTEIRLWNYK